LNSIEFEEGRLGNLKEIAEGLFDDEKDPRSIRYKRILIRPSINWIKIIFRCVIPLLAACAILMLLIYIGVSSLWAIVAALSMLLIYFCINAKRAIICLVRIYQRYAPDSVRNKCRFEPSCSQYMILSLQKYGLCKGLIKGIRRLKKCNVNGGGFDDP